MLPVQFKALDKKWVDFFSKLHGSSTGHIYVKVTFADGSSYNTHVYNGSTIELLSPEDTQKEIANIELVEAILCS